MKEKLGQKPAFPEPFVNDPHLSLSCDKGMSKRFYAACAAMQGLLSNPEINGNHNSVNIEWISRHAFMQADELLKQENL